MKKTLFALFLVVLIMLVNTYAFAQEKEEKSMKMGKEMMKHECKMHGEEMKCKGMMCCSQGMCPMHGMMMKHMMDKSIIATEDGGVLVVMGNRIAKYDEKLKLINEVELKMDMKKMHQLMKEMMDKCPMCKMMMGEGGMMQKMMKEKKETKEEKETEHEEHH